MRILKKGREQKGWAREFHCTGMGHGDGGCMSFLLVERADLFRTTQVHQSDQEHSVSFLCPECLVITDLADGNSPASPMELMPYDEWNRKRKVRLVPEGAAEDDGDRPPGGSFCFNGEERRM